MQIKSEHTETASCFIIIHHHRRGSFILVSHIQTRPNSTRDSPDFGPLGTIPTRESRTSTKKKGTHVVHPAHLRRELRQSKQQDHLDLQHIVQRPFGVSLWRDRPGQLGRIYTHGAQRRELIFRHDPHSDDVQGLCGWTYLARCPSMSAGPGVLYRT